MKNIKVDFSKNVREIKALHGVNNGPLGGASLKIDRINEFRDAGIPYSRLHDALYPFGSGLFVDIHCIFPNFDNDPEKPESYNFDMTDLYLEAIVKGGAKIIYRLGESIEHLPKKYYIYPPKDNLKWAKICEGIIRHYTEGWANGFYYDIPYWEIWGEPDNYGHLWMGTDEEYFELYRVAANYLKNRFHHLKIGGYGASGFYEVTKRVKWWELSQHCMDFAENFLKYISNEETKAPLDFFSWHLYYESPDEFKVQSTHVDSLLTKNGFENTESIITEWNASSGYISKNAVDGSGCAAVAAAVMCELQQETRVKIATYYNAEPRASSLFNGIFSVNNEKPTAKTYHVFKFFNFLYSLKKEAEVSHEKDEKIYALAATDGIHGGVMLTNIGEEKETVKITFSGICFKEALTACIYLIDDEHDGDFVREEIFMGDINSVIIKLEKDTTVLIKLS